MTVTLPPQGFLLFPRVIVPWKQNETLCEAQEARPVTPDIPVQKTRHMLFKTLKLAPVKHHSGGHFLNSHQDRGRLILELKAAPPSAFLQQLPNHIGPEKRRD